MPPQMSFTFLPGHINLNAAPCNSAVGFERSHAFFFYSQIGVHESEQVAIDAVSRHLATLRHPSFQTRRQNAQDSFVGSSWPNALLLTPLDAPSGWHILNDAFAFVCRAFHRASSRCHR